MADLVTRLRDTDLSGHGKYSALVREAADEIERLHTALKAGLRRIETRKPPGWPSTREWARDIMNNPAASARAAADAEATLTMIDALATTGNTTP